MTLSHQAGVRGRTFLCVAMTTRLGYETGEGPSSSTPTVSEFLPAGEAPPAQRQPHFRRNKGGFPGHCTLMRGRVKKPLTMIKGTLLNRFSSIFQADRMGYRSAT
jgi:hypothetical protein